MFSELNLFIVFILLITLPILNWFLLKARDGNSSIDPELLKTHTQTVEEQKLEKKDLTPAERLEHSQVISMMIGILGLAFIIYHFATSGFDLNINIVNFIFLFLGILLHKTPRKFLNSVSDAVKNAGGIIIQFPFYAGLWE